LVRKRLEKQSWAVGRSRRWEANGSDSGSCPVVDFGISSVEPPLPHLFLWSVLQ